MEIARCFFHPCARFLFGANPAPLRYMSYGDLRQCRLVNRAWCTGASDVPLYRRGIAFQLSIADITGDSGEVTISETTKMLLIPSFGGFYVCRRDGIKIPFP